MPAAGTQIQYAFAGLQVGDHERVAATQARRHCLGWQFGLLVGAVEVGAEAGSDLDRVARLAATRRGEDIAVGGAAATAVAAASP